MPVCAICHHLSLPPRTAAGTVGLLTSAPALVADALDSFGNSGEAEHVLVHACPEHVVDVYRGRIDGVRMAWRVGEDGPTPRRRTPAATSASPA